MKRIFLIVLDSVGIGELPDASEYGDNGANTIKSISKSQKFSIETLTDLGFTNIDGLEFLGNQKPLKAAVGRLKEMSKGKDTTIGHWEIAGVYSPKPLPTYQNGFPKEIIDEFSKQTGKGVLCNKPYSGTEVIKDYGKQHIKTGDLIVYTSADSVFQIAAHEDVVKVETLYEYCKIARKILSGEHGVGRVIARPFTGKYPFTRTSNRHDFSLEPPQKTILDAISENGLDCISIGKIKDIFAGRSITNFVYTKNNTEGMEKTMEYLARDFNGLCFINLVDFDMVYGHRNNVDGYANALTEFDKWLKVFLEKLHDDDILFITADHGCDPGDKSTDHTREYIPLIVYGKSIKPVNLGTRNTFSDIGATITDILNVEYTCLGTSFKEEIFYG